MAVPDPPFSTPRIMKVLEPSAGHYEVIVRMDPTLASKFPDKPFGTAITEIGLAAKDTAKYAGYTLVSIEPADKGGKDHYWIFQKLDGPAWTTTSKSKDNLTPQKYRSQTVVVKTEQEVDPGTAPTALAGDLVSSVVTQTPNTGKAVLSEVTETIAENSAALEGQQFAPDGTLLATSEDLVLDGTSADKSVNVSQSTVDPIGNGKSVRQTSTAKKRDTSDATVDGWPNKQKKSKGTDNLTPQKYRGQTVTSVTTEQVALAAVNVDDIPDPASPVSPQTVIEHEKVNDYRYEKRTITETIAENLIPLEGEEYGEIVTKSVSEVLVNDGTPADSGFNVISSMVEPIGNGKSVKQTKTAKGGWSDPINKEVSKEGADTPPPRYRKDLTRTKTTRKIAASAIPITPSLSGDEVAKSYQKETPDRAEETVVSQSFTLNTSSVDEAVEQKPFVKITSKMTPGTAPVVPASGNGSAKLVYEAPNGSKIYENTAEIATARPGPSGEEKDTKPFVTIKTAKRFSTTANISTLTGSANVVFNDGATQIYEVSEVTSTGRFGSAGVEQQTKPFVSITSTATYQNTGTLGTGEVGSTNKIYDDGSTTVYEKKVDTAVARPGPAGTEKDEKPFVKIETKKRYSPNADVATKTGSANIVFNDGKVQVYEVNEVTAVAKPGEAGQEKDEKPYVTIKTAKRYDTSNTVNTKTGASNKIYDDGDVKVFEINEVTSTAKPGLKGIETNAQQWGSIKSTTDYTTSDKAPSGGSVNLVYNDGQTTVYETTTTTATTSGTGKDVDSQQWGQIEWNGTYAKTTSGTRSRQVWSNGVEQVFFNETAALKVSGGTKEIDPNAWGSITWDGTYATSSGGQKSRQVARVGDTTVFLNENATLQPEGSTEEIDANSWGSITWKGTYSKSSSAGSNGKSRQVYSGPGGSVYLNETPTVKPLERSFQSAKKTTPTYTVTETTSFTKSSEASEPNSQTRLVFAQGTERVFEKTVRKVEPNRTVIYYSVINAQTPSVLKAILREPIKRKPNSEGPVRDKICIRADIEEGYSGLFPAKITEYFTRDAAKAEKFKQLLFKTKRIDYDGIQYQVSIGETLHRQMTLVDIIGTNDPDYVSLQKLPNTFTNIPATEPPEIPKGWQNYAIQIDPFEDGYLVKEIQVKYKD